MGMGIDGGNFIVSDAPPDWTGAGFMDIPPRNVPEHSVREQRPAAPPGLDDRAAIPIPAGPPPTRPSALASYGLLLGIAMIGLAAVWRLGFAGETLAGWFPSAAWAADLAWGSAAGVAFSIAAWAVFRQIPSFQHIKTLILRTIDMQTLAPRHAVMFGLIAGIPEEILFRGAMQPAFGVLVTTLIFAALHGVTRAYFIYAALASLLLSGLAIWSDGLWAPIAAHTTIDIAMFLLLMRTWRRRQRRVARLAQAVEDMPAG